MSGTTSEPMGTSPRHTRVQSSSTGRCGQQSAEKFRQGFTSIMSTMIAATTGSRISNSSRPRITHGSTPSRILGLAAMRRWRHWIGRKRPQKHGTPQKPAENGTGNTRSARLESVRSSLRYVRNAARRISRCSRREASFAVSVANVEVISGDPVSVYDLTVEHHHCYFANGVLVSNSDALGALAVGYAPPKLAMPSLRRRSSWVSA